MSDQTADTKEKVYDKFDKTTVFIDLNGCEVRKVVRTSMQEKTRGNISETVEILGPRYETWVNDNGRKRKVEDRKSVELSYSALPDVVDALMSLVPDNRS